MEIEARVKINDFEALEQKLVSIGAEFFMKKKQTDYVYKTKGKELESLGPGSFILRVRESNKNVLTYKSLTKNPGVFEEYETEISNPKAMKKIITSSGFGLVYTMVKTRIPGKLEDFTLCLDDVEGLGKYMEIELDSDEEDIAMERINGLFEKIGFKPEEITRKGYSLMILEKLGVGYVKGYSS